MKPYIYLLLLLTLVIQFPFSVTATAPSETLASTFEVVPTHTNGFKQENGSFRLTALQGSLESEVFSPGWEFMAVGVTWAEGLPPLVSAQLDVRVSDDGVRYDEWTPLTITEEHRPDNRAVKSTELLFIKGKHIQIRAALQNPTSQAISWEGLQVTLIDGRPGATAQELAKLRAGQSPDDAPVVITRAQWGADESYRFDDNGDEIWQREYSALRALFAHHTATNPSSDPAAAVRAIYYYHAVAKGWGDLGYHYLVDQYGNIYQGRYGTEQDGLVVKGAHALGYNWNTMGISMIGNFTNVSPPDAQLNALKEFFSWRAFDYEIDPMAAVLLYGEGDNPDRWHSYSVLGHRDSHDPARTSCPGDQAYNQLPDIRAYMVERIEQLSLPVVQIVSPAENAVLDGMVTLQANGSANVERVEYFLDESLIASSNNAPWSVTIDSQSLASGSFTFRATAITAAGNTASEERTIHVPTFTFGQRAALSATATMTVTTPTLTASPTSPSNIPPSGAYQIYLPLIASHQDALPPTATPTASPSPTRTMTPTPYPTPDETATPSPTPTMTAIPSPTPTTTAMPSPTATMTAIPSATPTATPTATPQASCTQLLSNNSFDSNTDWLMLLGHYAARYTNESVWSAPRSLRTGMAPGDNYAGFSSARQAVPIPADAASATLSLRYLPQTGSAADTDRQYIGLLDAEGSYIASVVPSGLTHSDDWLSASYDLADYRGQTIYIYLGVKNDGVDNSTRLYVDDVQVEVCTQ